MKSISGNHIIMKELNINLVKDSLRAEKLATKQKLSELTGLTTVTISSILKDLIEKGEVYEYDIVASNGGRPAKRFCFNNEYSHAIIIYTNEINKESKINIRVINLEGRSIYKDTISFNEINLDSFENIIESLIIKFKSVKAIGFGLPGTEINNIMVFNDYKNLVGTNFTQYYQEKFKVPVILENDANAAVTGYFKNNGLENETIVYIFFPSNYPPGAGIYLNGSPYKGRNNFAGEIKYIPLGIDWENINYNLFDDICSIISKLIISFSSVINPDKVVISANFISDKHIEAITLNCKNSISEIFIPEIVISSDFENDFENGIIECTLNLLKPKLSLKYN